MRWIQNLDLKNKLVLLAAVSGAMALLMACAGFVCHDLRLLRSTQIDELRVKAQMIAFISSSVVSNDQRKAATSLLEALKSQTSIETIGLFNRRGEPIAFDPTTFVEFAKLKLPEEHDSYRYTDIGELELFHPINERGREIGIVYVKANMREFYEQVYSHAAMIVTVTLCSLGVALLFASMMQSLISKPILQLADAARNITTNDDYTIRVSTVSHDELGVLYSAFNRMVEKIQSSQAELKHARDDMEGRVEQRTRQLQDEINQRGTIQQELLRAKEAAEAASESKSRFLANMSHEIRTPLNGILGFTDFILFHDHDLHVSDRRDYLSTIKKSAEALLALINDILDLSKIEAGQMDFEKVRFCPHSVIADVVSFLRPKACEKSLSLEYRWNGSVPESIESDPLRFRQLLMNLVGNAVKFTQNGRVEVVVKLDDVSRMLIVDVSDTGVGIALEAQKVLFKPFSQGDSSVTRRFGGTGLGLSICKNIVRGLGGEIGFTSEISRGSTFTFAIETGSLDGVPRSSRPVGDIVSQQQIVSCTTTLQSRRILVAEDGDTNRKLIHLLLLQSGAEVVMVENGLDAVDAARNFAFDLILLDMQMPVMDGYTAARELRAAGFTRPIVALTAHAMRGDEDRCLEAGCSEYLTKPIRQEQLLAKISELITQEFMDLSHASGPLISELPVEKPAYAELVSEFIDHAREKLIELQNAHRANNNEQLAKLAHWMKGTGGMAGFPILTENARELECSVLKTDAKEIESRLAIIESLVGRLQSPSTQAL